MHDAFLKCYEEELGHIREVGAEFGRQYPRIAGRLALNREDCEDPFVERMIEGFAFLAARVRTRLEAEYPMLSESLLETIYPQILGPVPAMSIVEMTPDDKLTGSFAVPRGSVLTSHLGEDEDTRCEFRTAHEVTLRPLRIDTIEAPRYFSRDIDRLRLPSQVGSRAAVRLRLMHAQPDKLLNSLEDVDELTFHIGGSVDSAGALYEEFMTHCTHVLLRPVGEGLAIPPGRLFALGEGDLALEPVGFEAEDALLPSDVRTFEGFRLLREFAVLPQRFLFFRLSGIALREFITGCEGRSVDVIFIFNRSREELAKFVNEHRFRLFATPVVNLFERRADQIQLSERFDEAHVVVDKTRPLAFEVFKVQTVRGIGDQAGARMDFEPFYRCANSRNAVPAFFTVRRERRRLTHREIRFGSAPTYTGSEIYISLVDSSQALHRDEISALSVRALCSNRHLPLYIPIGVHETDFFASAGIPVSRVQCLTSPTKPIEAPVGGNLAWSLISHLSLNYLSLVETESGASALREILGIYTQGLSDDSSHWTSGLVGVKAKPVVRRHLSSGPVAFVRGLEVTLQLDESKLAGSSPYLLGGVLAKFLSGYVSINSFVETRVESSRRGQIARWSGVNGRREIL